MATITSAQTGSWSATATWVGGVVPTSADDAVIASGHTVTLDTTGLVCKGLDISGVLSASTTASSSLTSETNIYKLANGSINIDISSNANITCILELNNSNSGTTTERMFGNNSAVAGDVILKGAVKTVYTKLNGALSVGATSATVLDTTGWRVGDTVILCTTEDDTGDDLWKDDVVTLTGISGNTISWSGGTSYSYKDTGYVGNLSRNLKIRPASGGRVNGIHVKFVMSASGTAGTGVIDLSYVEFDDVGRAGGYAINGVLIGASESVAVVGCSTWNYKYYGIIINDNEDPNCTYSDLVFAAEDTLASQRGITYLGGAQDERVKQFERVLVARAGAVGFAYEGAYGFGAKDCVIIGAKRAHTATSAFRSGQLAVFDNCEVYSSHNIFSTIACKANNCNLGVGLGANRYLSLVDKPVSVAMTSCTTNISGSDIFITGSGSANDVCDILYKNVDNDVLEHTHYLGWVTLRRDNTDFIRSPSSARYDIQSAGNQTKHEFNILASSGQTIRVIGYCKFDSSFYNSNNYYSPTVTLSGLGETPVTYTATSSANGAWEKFDISITNSTANGGEFLLTYIVQGKASNSGSVWFSGVPDYPWVASSRHYGFRIPQVVPYVTTDPLIVDNESTASAYTGVTINGTTSTISFASGTADTAQKFYDFSRYWCVVNIDNEIPFTRAGASYTLTDGWKVIDPYYSGTLTWSGGTVEYTTYGTYDDNIDTSIVNLTVGGGDYNFTGNLAGTITFNNDSGSTINVYVPAGTTTATTGANTTNIFTAVETFTITSNVTATIRYFASGSQTPIDSTSGTSLSYLYTVTDPIDIEVLADGYVPFRASGITPTNSSYSVTLKSDPVYISGHGLTYTTDYSYNRTTKVLTITAAQEGRSIYSSLIEQYRTNSTLFNTDFLMTAIGIDRVDFTDGMTIDSGDIQFWKGAGMQWYTSGDTVNPTHKFCSIKSVGTIAPSASCYVQQVYGGTPVALTLSGSNKIDSVVQYWSDPNHDGSVADGYDYSGFLLFKTFKDGYYQGRTDVIQAYGISELESYEYTINLSNVATGLGTGTRGLTITVTDHTAAPIDPQSSGDYFDYKITEASNAASAEDILRQWIYDISSDPTATYNGKTAANWGDPLYLNGSSYETKVMYVEGQETSTDQHGTYVEQASDYHPGFNRQQANDLSYWVTPLIVTVDMPNIIDGSRVYLYNEDASSVIDNSVVAGGSGYSKVINNFTTNINVSYRVCYQSGATAKYPLVGTGVITSSGLTITATQTDDAVHNNYGVDGSTVTELTADYANIQIDVNDADNVFDARRGVAWWRYITQTSQGIASYNPNAISYAPDIYNIVVDGALQIENIKAAALKITNGVWTRSDGGDLIASTSNTIHWIPDNRVYSAVVETGVSGLTAAESAKIDLISGIDVRVDDIHKIHGLDSVNPVTVTPTSRSVGNVTQQITGDGQTTSTVTRL